MRNFHLDERLTRDEVMLEQLVHPFWRHHQTPLPILEILLALVAHLAGLIDHVLNLQYSRFFSYFKNYSPSLICTKL